MVTDDMHDASTLYAGPGESGVSDHENVHPETPQASPPEARPLVALQSAEVRACLEHERYTETLGGAKALMVTYVTMASLQHMHRLQVQLTEEQSDRLRAAAETEGASQAELVRRALDAYLRRPSRLVRRPCVPGPSR